MTKETKLKYLQDSIITPMLISMYINMGQEGSNVIYEGLLSKLKRNIPDYIDCVCYPSLILSVSCDDGVLRVTVKESNGNFYIQEYNERC